ncbi:benenodin family lasso peptide [Novosphingobium resinovorum]|jgi:hypothetical protein|nr:MULTISPECIES: benenodin family lasso peptide [Novosphingobium]MBF7013711.1 benenodin family lasso peptide [Novosphingobium sp. HR1a]WJM25853.1 benenodin family lasso peptide [Novosphingobium resinovorum]
MEREHEAADDGVVELGIASEVTHGTGQLRIDNPQGQPVFGILDD